MVTPATADVKKSMKVDLYTEYDLSGCHLGWILYGHLANPISSGWRNLSGGTNWVHLGLVPGHPGACGSCSCYTAAHTHLECSSGVRLSANGSWVNAGTTPAYRWTVPAQCPI